MGCQNCFRVYSTKVRWRFSREELKSQFFGGIWVTKYPTAGKIFSAGLSKLKSMCPEDFLRERFFRRTFFGLRAVHLAIFWRNNNRVFVKTIFNSFRGLFGKRFLNQRNYILLTPKFLFSAKKLHAFFNQTFGWIVKIAL